MRSTAEGEVRGASRLPELTLMLVTLVWGSTFIVTQVAMRETGPFSLLAARFVIGALTLLAIFAGRMRGLRAMELRVGIMIGAVTFASYSLQTIGLQHIASSKSAFITALYVPLVPLLQLLLLRQAPRLAAWIGIALAFAGLMLMSIGKGMDLAIGVGEWLTLGSALGAALQIILLSRWVQQADPMRLAFVQLSTVSVLSLAGAGLAGERVPALSPTLVAAALGLGLLGTAFALGAMSWAQRTVSATRATVIYSMEPVWGGLIGAWAGELMTPAVVGGSTLVLLGVLTSELRWPRQAARGGNPGDSGARRRPPRRGGGRPPPAAGPAIPVDPRDPATAPPMAPTSSLPPTPDLPIEAAVPALRDALRGGRSAVLQAPPGAGKTTRVPLALLTEPWMKGRRMVMLEPRRLAARAAAARMAATLGEPVGHTVGYRVRHDTRVGRETRIEVVTEGILTRMLQGDPGLEGIGLVVFDEFHERSIHADMGLALVLQARALLRDDLRILVMSATLDGAAVARLLEPGAGAAIVTSEGRSYPVETRYLARPVDGWIEPAVARSVRGALAEDSGDVLVFLPGAGEIRRVEEYLRDGDLPVDVGVHPLHGSLPQDAQDRAIAPSSRGRKVVLSTAIAETSLTIEGVGVVVDSGLMRVPRFSPRIGMTRLETVAVSRASADQRRGRAGRLGPGVCYRLWTEQQHGELLAHGTPEIRAADLAPLALELAVWGADDAEQLAWLDPPAPAAYAQARELLTELGALAGGRITPHGRRMAGLGMHPRLAHMALRAQELGSGGLACEIAALLGERDLLRADGPVQDADLRLRLDALRDPRAGRLGGFTIDRGAAERARAEARQLRQRLGIPAAASDPMGAGVLLSLAYPDRIAQQREPGSPRYLLRNGAGATLRHRQALSQSSYLAVAELDGRARDARVALAAPLSLAELETTFADQIELVDQIAWDPVGGSVRATRRALLGGLVLREGVITDPDPAGVRAALLGAVVEEGLGILPWSSPARQLQQRVLFLRALDHRWPDLSDAALSLTCEEWLDPHLAGIRRRTELDRLDLASILAGLLPWELRAKIDELAPTHLVVPTGSRIPIDYADPGAPSVAVRLQEMFGLAETPRVAGVPLTVHFLSPAHRPVQVTRDLASFWREGYFEVRKDLRSRYPRHSWPDDPLRAEPTRRAKRR